MTETQLSPHDSLPEKSNSDLKTLLRSPFSTIWGIAVLYLLFLTLAEALTNLIEPRAGVFTHGVVLVALLLHSSRLTHGAQRRFLLVLTLAPLIRILSLSLPLPSFPYVYWYLVVGVPLFIAAFIAARAGKMNKGMVGLKFGSIPVQILIGATGVLLGTLEYLILRPAPLVAEFSWQLVLVPSLILLIFTGFLEEVIFRGMMQYAALPNFGRFGLVYVAMLFAVLHLGYHSMLDVFFVFLVAMFFGWVTLRTGSILGVSLSHGFTNIFLYLVLPFVVAVPVVKGTPTAPPSQGPQPGLLAPITVSKATRQWLPPTSTPFPISTPTLTLTSIVVHPTTQLALPTDTNTPAPVPTCGPPAGWVRYTVQYGDTVSLLSRLLGIEGKDLRQANCLETNEISVGHVIYVPFQPPPHGLPTVTPRPPAAFTPTPKPTWFTATPSMVPQPSNTPPNTPTTVSTKTPLPTPTSGPTDASPPTRTSPPPTDTPLPQPTVTPMPPTPADTPSSPS
jgi:membrane protease YdiL (CAAX protease family)